MVRRSAFLSLAREVVGRKVRAGFASVGAMAELDQVATWANCGAMSLTGRVDGPPLVGPAGLVDVAASVAADLAAGDWAAELAPRHTEAAPGTKARMRH